MHPIDDEIEEAIGDMDLPADLSLDPWAPRF
jgi:hypothetical protein